MSNTVKEALNIFLNDWSKQIILYGPPGTSKTYSAVMIAARFLAQKNGVSIPLDTYQKCEEYLRDKDDQYKVIQFHPSYSYEDFVRGITVKPSETGVLPEYKVEKKIIERFDKPNGKAKVLVIDEINRAPLASVLGELIYGLEKRGSKIYTPYTLYNENGEEETLTISDNLYIIGTMNTADRSIGSMDYAVRRRFAFVPVMSDIDEETLKSTWKNEETGNNAYNLYLNVCKLFDKEHLEDPDNTDPEDIKIGHTYFLGPDGEGNTNEEEYLKFRMKYQVKPIIMEYIKDGLLKKTVEDEINKILRKIGIDC